MLDDLRNSSSFIDDEPEPQEEVKVERKPVRRKQKEQKFLGLTAQQRFLISLILFFMVCILGTVALYISGSISLF